MYAARKRQRLSLPSRLAAVDVHVDIGIEMCTDVTIEVTVEGGIKPRCSSQVHLPARERSLHEHEGNRVEAGPINRVAVLVDAA